MIEVKEDLFEEVTLKLKKQKAVSHGKGCSRDSANPQSTFVIKRKLTPL
jgi:hypothetical protein